MTMDWRKIIGGVLAPLVVVGLFGLLLIVLQGDPTATDWLVLASVLVITAVVGAMNMRRQRP